MEKIKDIIQKLTKEEKFELLDAGTCAERLW